jgi:transposase
VAEVTTRAVLLGKEARWGLTSKTKVYYDTGVAMKRRKPKQQALWIVAPQQMRVGAHPFYEAVNELLEAEGFDSWVEKHCAQFYAPTMGRPSIEPGRYFRAMLVGYFEGIESDRGIAWRLADSLGVRSFLGLEMGEGAPDHSTLSRTRRLYGEQTHQAFFEWILALLFESGKLNGKRLGIDATTLEANAAMRSIVRRDTSESYNEYLKKLAAADGKPNASLDDLKRFDKERKGKRVSNEEWASPIDPEAMISRMKDGSTHMAHKAEHAVDMESGAIVAITVYGGVEGDTQTLPQTLDEAEDNLKRIQGTQDSPTTDVVADKGYHSNSTLKDVCSRDIRSYIAEPKQVHRNWSNDPDARLPYYANRRRIRSRRGKAHMRKRGEIIERSFAHMYETGGLRRLYLRGHKNIRKRLQTQAAAFNISILIREKLGSGKPRALANQARRAAHHA